ncbi:MAG: MFS transporter [Armatimonadota bacterium]|nr:MFS transporter [Armatimonadota bacterium]
MDYRWQALAAVAVGTFMSTLDSSIVNVSLPTIGHEFAADITVVEWVVMAYLLTVAGLLLSVGRLADMRGRKLIYNLGFGVFTLGSLACALSQSIAQLIAARVLQGVGAAMLAANGAAILTTAFPRSERGKAMGLNGTIVATGLTVGPPLGGLLVHAFGWRSIFTINLPIGAAGMLLAHYLLRPDGSGTRGERFDVPGALALWASLSALLLALSRGEAWGWSAPPTVALFLSSGAAAALFVLIERRAPHPVVDLSLFRNRLFSAGSGSALISYIAIATATFLTPFYLKHIKGFTTAQVGITLTVVPLTMMGVSPLSGWLSDRLGSRFLSSAGIGVISLGLMALGTLTPHTSTAGVAMRLFLVGLGNGLFTSPNSSAIMGAVPATRLGIAAGMISTVRTMGTVTGVALAGAVVAARRSALLGADFDPTAAFAGAIQTAYLVAAGVAAAGVLLSMVRGPEERRAP